MADGLGHQAQRLTGSVDPYSVSGRSLGLEDEAAEGFSYHRRCVIREDLFQRSHELVPRGLEALVLQQAPRNVPSRAGAEPVGEHAEYGPTVGLELEAGASPTSRRPTP